MKIKPAIGSASTKIFFLLLLLISLIVCNKQSERKQDQRELKIQPKGWDSSFVKNSEAKELLKKKYYPRYNILQTGNYALLDKDESETFFLNDSTLPKDEKSNLLLLCKIIVYNKKKKELVECNVDELSIMKMDVSDRDLAPLLKKNIFGPWNGYFFVYDLNGNGLNEIIALDSGGCWQDLVIYEFIDGEFVKTIKSFNLYFYNIDIMETDKIMVITISEYEGAAYDKPIASYYWLIYNWNPEKKRYLVINEGKWEENEIPTKYLIDEKR